MNMAVKPLDVLLLLKLVAYGDKAWNYSRLSADLGIAASQLHVALRRSAAARLLEYGPESKPYRPYLKEFLIHGVKYCFPSVTGGLVRGIPTSYAAPPLNSIISETSDPPPVWPYARGEARGIALTPIHRAVPEAAMKDPKLYELLALVDAIRAGRAREREIAARELSARIDGQW